MTDRTAPRSSSRRSTRARRACIAGVIVGGIVVVGYHYVVPEVVAMEIRSELSARGFPDARFHVESVGLDHVRLSGVTLRDGLELGDVELDAGISMLWGGRAEQITIRRARFSADGLLEPTAPGGGGVAVTLPFERVRLEACEVAIGDVRVSVSGTIASSRFAKPSVDLVATSGPWHLGPVTFRDVVVRAQDADEGIRACVSARTAEAAVEACSSLSMAIPRGLHALDVTWRAHALEREASGWSARGSGHVAWPIGKAIGLEDGLVEVVVPLDVRGGATIEHARVSAVVEGSLAQLVTKGEARAEQIVLRDAGSTTKLLDVALPFTIAGSVGVLGFKVTASESLVAHAREASTELADKTMRATGAAITFGPDLRVLVAGVGSGVWPHTLPWTAANIRWGDLRFTGASGTLLDASRVGRWQATEARWRDVRVEGASGTELGAKTERVHWRASRARWRDARFTEPSGTIELASARSMRWQAKTGTWHGARFQRPTGRIDLEAAAADHNVAWSGVKGPGPLELGGGNVVFRNERARMRIVGGNVQAMGGVLSVGSVVEGPHERLDVMVNVRGVQLQRVLAGISRGHIDGTGMLDGELGLSSDESGWSLTGGSLRGRGTGAIRVADAEWRRRAAASTSQYALHQRIAGALADFEYSQLAVALGPQAAGPDLRISTRGRGKRVLQELDLVINLRGVRHAMRRIALHVDR